MVKYILALQQLRCNNNKESSNKISNSIKDESIQLIENLHNQISNKTLCETSINDGVDIYGSGKYLRFISVQKIIHQFLNYNRIVLLPHIIPKLTDLELSQILNITTEQLKKLQKSPSFYKKVAKHVSRILVNLYCNTGLQRPEVIHNGDTHHG